MSILIDRMKAFHQQLMAGRSGGVGMQSSTLGNERENFISCFLEQAISPGFRFGTGQAIDHKGNISKQLDIVIESHFAPSIALLGSNNTRLYTVESICTVIEVKSDLVSKWDEVLANYQSVISLKGSPEGGAGMEDQRLRSKNIGYFAVGYNGWKDPHTVKNKWLSAGSHFDGILQLEPLIFVHKNNQDDTAKVWENEIALFRFLDLMISSTQRHVSRSFDLELYN